MKRGSYIFLSFFVTCFFVFGNNLDTFFAQDDFILISKFTQNNLFKDFINIFSFSDTHFRPIHNLYFLLLGNIFYKSHFYYHLVALLIHTLAALLVFIIAKKFLNNLFSAYASAFFYLVNSSHFVSLYWISGNATELGFIFFCFSLLFWFNKRFYSSLLMLVLAVFASESYLVTPFIFAVFEFLKNKSTREITWLVKTFLIFGLIAVVRLIYLTPTQIYETYRLEFSLKLFTTIKYYLLRIVGFSETSGDLLISLAILFFMSIAIKRLIDIEIDLKKMKLFGTIFIAGLFPFIFLPYHTSAHYMNLSIFGSSLFIGLTFEKKSKVNYLLIALFLAASIFNVTKLQENHWVVIKSRIAEAYIRQIEGGEKETPDGSTLIFNNNRISSSLDAYLALGGGQAIDFWFKGKNYKYCFTEFETCDVMP